MTLLLNLVDASIRIALWVQCAQVRREPLMISQRQCQRGLRSARFGTVDSVMGYGDAHTSTGIKV
jgi:hypothetical protein